MCATSAEHPYEARIRVNGKVIYSINGKNIKELQPKLHEQCLQEGAGAECEIIELATGKVVYHCRRDTIIDQ